MAQYLSEFLNTAFSTYTENDAFNDSVVYPITLTHTTTGTPANGIGTGLRFITETSNTNNEIGGLIEVVTTDVTSGSEDFDFVFKTMAAGATAAEKLRIKSTGELDVAGNLIVSGGRVTLSAASNRDKYRLWNNSTYTIGLVDSVTYGGVDTEKAMTFQMDNNSSQGFWWGDSTHTVAQGAMALTTDGKLTVAHSMRLGYGESDTTTPGATFKLDVNGNIAATTIDFGEVTIGSTTGIDSWKYNGNLFSTTSEDNNPSDIFIDNTNGSYLLMLGSQFPNVYKYAFTTAYKVDTLSYLDLFDVGAEEQSPTSLFARADGTKIYVVGLDSDSVHQYDLSTGWDFSTASFVDSKDISSQDTQPHGLFFKPDGTKMYILGQQNTRIYEYNLGTAWDITTATYSQQLSISANTPKPTSMKMASDGNTLYVLDSVHDSISKFNLSSSWNITSAAYADEVDISTITTTVNATSPTGFDISSTANKVYVVCSDNDKIFEYDTTSESARVAGNRLIVDEDLHVKNNLIVYNNARVHDALEVAKNLAVNGDSITTVSTTFNFLNTTVDSLSIGGAASFIDLGSGTSLVTLANDASVQGDLTVVGTLTGTLTGSASSWTTSRTITLGGDLSGSVSINGTADVTLTATIGANSVALGTDTTGNYVASITNGSFITGGNGGSEGATLTLAVDATTTNTASKVVARDASGNFAAGTITAALSGNATTATTLATARTIAISGDVTGTATSFDGSANIAISAAITADSIVNADINSAAGIVDTKLATIATAGKVSNSATTATNANTANAIVARDASGNFSAGTITASLSGNASTVTNGAYTTNNLSVFAATTSSQLAGVISDETGSGALVFGTGPTITLPIVNNIKQGYSTTATAAGTTILTVNSNRVQFFTGTNTQVLSLPAPQSMTLGMEFLIVNNSTGSIEVRAANAATVITVLPGTVASCISIDLTAGNGAAGWNAEFVGFSSVTGTGANVLATSPTLVTPTLGVASATSINKVTLTAPATGSTLTIADGKTLTASNTLTFTGTDSSSVAFGSGGTVAYTGGTLAQFAATTSLQLAGVISDETGSGALVFGTSPSFTTSIVAASATMGLFDTTATTVDAFGATTTLNLGYDSTAASTTNISTGAVANATTKTVNIGTGGATGSTTNINLGSSSGGTVTVNNNLTVTGNLTVNGTTTTVNSTTVTLDDPILTLGGDTAPSTDDNKDRGIEFRWHNGSAAKVGFFGFDDSTGRFTFIPDATNTSEVFSGTTGILDVASITGSAASWTTARTITLGGDLSGNVSIDGSANVTLTATIAADSVALGTDTTGNYVASITNGSYITGGNGGSEGAGLTLAVDATTTNTASKVVARDSSGDFSAGTITAALSGNATTATTLATSRTISLGGDLSGSASFNGSADITITATIAANSVALGTDTTGNYVATVADATPGAQTGTSGLTITSVAGEGTATTIAHADTSSAANLTATSRTYVTGLTFDTFGHVTAYTTGSETVTNTNTTYSVSTEAGGDIYSEIIRLTAGGSGSGTDDIILAVGATGTTYGLTIAESGDTITFAHADTSTLSGSQGSAGIASISVDEMGHVTAVTTATYLTSQSSDFGTITVTDTDSGYTWAGTGSAVADATGDTLTLVSGSGINIDVDAASDAIRITNTFAESDTLSSVTGRGATTATAISITNATNSTSTSSGALIVTGGIGIGGDLFVGGGDISAGNVATTLLGGNTTTNISFANALTSGTLTVGGTSQTGTMTIDPSTSAHTLNIATGANTSGTKTVNIATGSTTSGVTAVTIGSTNSTSSVAIRSGTGGVDINSIKWPTTDGSIGQALVTNGAGQLNFQNVAGGGIVASSYIAIGILSTDQTVTSGADTLINFVDYDDAQSWWNPTTKRFTPTIAGYYDVTLSAWWVAGVISNNQTNLQIRKNGNSYALSQEIINTSTGQSPNLNRTIYLNGTTDYLDFTVFTSNTTSQVLQKGTVDGSGTFFSAALITSGCLTGNILEDTTPQLGGNLDVNGQSIVSAVGSNGNILITPDGTGYIQLDGLRWPTADGSNGFLLSTNGSGQLAWTSAGSNTTYTISAETATNTVLRLTGSDASTDNVAFVGSGIVSVTRTDANTITITGTEADTLSSVTGRGATTATAISITNTTASTTVDTGALTVDGGVGMNGNLFVGGLANIAGNLTVSGGTITAGNVATTLLGGNTTAAVDFATAQTSGALTIGGTSQTGTITLDRSTVAHTLNIATGTNASGVTKTINLGTGGASGSTTAINIGSSTSGATNTVNIFGDLTVTGTTTYVNTTTLNVGDNIITLNADETGTPSQNAGIEIERGTSTNTALIWNETTDRWQFTNDGSTYFNIPTSSEYGVVNDGTLTLAVSGSGLTGSATFTANQAGNSTFTVTSNATAANTGSTIVFRDASGNFSAGVITATSVNKVAITAPATGSTLTIADGKTLTASNTLTFTGTDASSVAFGAGGTVAYTGGTLAQFAATTSSQLAGVISDETGSGALVFGTSPAITTSITTGSASFDVFNTTATTVNAFGAATTLAIGNTATAAQTVNMFTASTGASTYNFATGATATTTTKTLNIGTGGAAGSTTNVNIGSSVAGTTTISSPNITISGLVDTATAASHYYIETASSGNILPKTLANVRTEIVTTAAVNAAAATTTGTVTSGTWSASFGAVSGANLTSLTAGNLSGTIPSGVLGNSSLFVGTTSIALNRGSANLGLTGITSVAMPGATSGTITITPAATAGTTAITIPATTGTLITSGDTGTVTSTMILDGTIVNGDINASAGIVDTKLATIATAGKVSNSATTATNLNTASAIVARDASGNFSAGTITATLSGNASTATTAASWTTARTITLGGDLSGSVSISGGADVTLTATIAANSVALGTDTTGNYVAGLTAGNGISVTGTAAEGWSPTVAMTGSYTGTFTATGDICAYSDVTLKDNIEVISDPLTKVLKLRGVTFTRKDLDDNKTHMGVIAQEVEEVIPEVVITNEDGIKTVAYGNMVGLLIEAVKELTNQNKELVERVAQLESKLNG